MHAEEFLKNVVVRADLKDKDEGHRAVRAVLDALRARITPNTIDNIGAQLPKEVQEHWRQGFIERISRMAAGSERMDLGGFIAKVAVEYGTADMDQAEAITRAVFTTMREQITPGAQHSIEHELPEDIRMFWLECNPPAMPEEKGPGELGHVGAIEWEAEENESMGLITEPPYEFEAPVVQEEEEIAGAKAGVSRFDMPMVSEMGMEELERPTPAEDRIVDFPPPSEYESVEGPGSQIHYRSDPQLTEEIEELLRSSEHVDSEHINVFVQAGNVTLRGTVRSPGERQSAAVLASKALGVGEIRNELTVEEGAGEVKGPAENI